MDKLSRRYTFTIDAFTPDTLPMARLADYLKELADLLGEKEHVHFEHIKRGSANLSWKVDSVAVPKVRGRLRVAGAVEAPEDVTRHYQALNDYLGRDNAIGAIREDKSVLVRFPGRTAPQRVGPVIQEGELVGVLVRIGGTTKDVRATIQTSDATHSGLTLDVGTARKIAVHLYGPPLRLIGTGTWWRRAEGGWDLERFHVRDFDVLRDETLLETVARLQAVEGSGWNGLTDPLAELHRIRHGEEPGA